jgi:hypothetical protein
VNDVGAATSTLRREDDLLGEQPSRALAIVEWQRPHL